MRETGTLPYQLLRQAMQSGVIQGAHEEHLQPSSIDLSLSEEAYELKGSYLPRKQETVRDLLKSATLCPHSLEEPLQAHHVYLIRLNETLRLPPELSARTSNKSSSGRINLRTRLVADGVTHFDRLPSGYAGELWLEVIPKSFSVRVHSSDRLNQLRLFTSDARLSPIELRFAYRQYGLLRDSNGQVLSEPDSLQHGLPFSIDLSSADVVAWRGKVGTNEVLDTRVFDHNPSLFFEPIEPPEQGELVIHPGDFWIFSTKEAVVVPPCYAAEMIAFDPANGEFRSHFAGFFDPGFGWSSDQPHGAVGVLEVEAYGHDFILRDGQPICLMAYEHVLDIPEKAYGMDLKSNYQWQSGPKLAKWFKKLN